MRSRTLAAGWVALAAHTLLLLTGGAAAAEPRVRREASTVRVRVVLPPALAAAAPIVNLSPAGAPQAYRTVALTSARLATFADVAVATYDISVIVPGGETAATSLRIDAHEVVTLTATVAPAGAGSSRLELTDRHRVGDGVLLNERFLRDLPSTSHLSALVETVAPFVVVDHMDNGGLAIGRNAFMGSRGASWASTQVVFDRQPLADLGRVGLMAVAPDLSGVESVDVMHGTAPVDVSTPGAHVTLSPRLPGAAWRGTLRTSFTTPGMVATNALTDAPSIARLESWRDVGGVIGGPIRRDMGLLVSGSASHTRQQERDDARRVTAGAASLFGRAVLRPTSRDGLQVSAGGARVSRPFDGREQFAGHDAREQMRTWHAATSWQRVGLSGALVSLSGGVQRHTTTPSVPSDDGGVVDRVRDGVMPEPPTTSTASQWGVDGRIQTGPVQWREMDHHLRAGVTVRRSTVTSSVIALPVVAQSVGGRPARVWLPVAPQQDSTRAATHTALYVEDRVDVTPSFTVLAGSRFDLVSGSAEGAEHGVSWQTASPRASFRWKIGPLTVFGGYGRYASELNLFLLAYGDPGAPWAAVHRWEDPNRNGAYDDGERGVLVARAGPGAPVASIDRGLRAPRTSEWTAGGELPIGRRQRIRGSIAIRRQSHVIGSINAGVPRSSYRELFIPDQNTDWHGPDDDHLLPIYDRRVESFGRDEFLLTNPDRAAASYDGIEIAWDLQSERWQMMFGATAYRAEGFGAHPGFGVLENDQGIVGEQYAFPNAAADTRGRLFFDRAYVGKWAGSYRAPRDVRVAFVARYQDGQPFSRVVIADLSTGPEMIQAYAVGRTRFTYTTTIDARVEKGFDVRGRRAAVQLDVFNLTNHRNEVEEDVVTGPAFRRSTAVQPPLTVRLGFRFDF